MFPFVAMRCKRSCNAILYQQGPASWTSWAKSGNWAWKPNSSHFFSCQIRQMSKTSPKKIVCIFLGSTDLRKSRKAEVNKQFLPWAVLHTIKELSRELSTTSLISYHFSILMDVDRAPDPRITPPLVNSNVAASVGNPSNRRNVIWYHGVFLLLTGTLVFIHHVAHDRL